MMGHIYAGEKLDDLHGYLYNIVVSLLNKNSDTHQCNSVECYFKFVVLVPSPMTVRERTVIETDRIDTGQDFIDHYMSLMETERSRSMMIVADGEYQQASMEYINRHM